MRALRYAAVVGALSASLVCPAARAQDIPCVAPEPATGTPATPQDVAQVRRFATGAGVRVAVIDTGVAPNPEFAHVSPGADFVSPGAPNPLLDCDGHGTVVAGIIASATLGIAPDVELLSIRQTSQHYRSIDSAGSLSSLADAIGDALDRGARVINISVVSCLDPRDAARLDTRPLDDVLRRAEETGAIVISAAGNETPTCRQGWRVLPAHAPTVLAVGAREDSHSVASYSVASETGGTPLSAPGSVQAGVSWGGSGFASGRATDRDTTQPFSGTSFAAPVVTGSVALLLQRNPTLTPAEVRARVIAAAEPAGGAVDPLAVVTQTQPDPQPSRAPLSVAQNEAATSPALARSRGAAVVMAALAGLLWCARSSVQGRSRRLRAEGLPLGQQGDNLPRDFFYVDRPNHR
ncbi:Subtilisin DY [Corynebacterium capitovis DSM 44611]|uniref:S8 family serine peptidase n=1 Tax=Corynebacterium capitovis TaxID=131081 RepID=UPI000A01ABDE|nr:S8 family serine peptidase [Corynebacterium capitovis]WKD56887.1 Subtilisin DY [Corynebacterium capitovis DSM 44611]